MKIDLTDSNCPNRRLQDLKKISTFVKKRLKSITAKFFRQEKFDEKKIAFNGSGTRNVSANIIDLVFVAGEQ